MNCGKQLDEAAKFCAGCGAKSEQPAPVQAAQPQQPPQAQPYIQPQQQYQQPYAPQYQQAYAPAPKPKSKTPLIVGGIGGALALVFVVVLIATNVFGLLGKIDSGELGDINVGGSSTPGNTNGGKIDFNAIFAGTSNIKLKGLSETEKQAIIDAGAAAGVEVTFLDADTVIFTRLSDNCAAIWTFGEWIITDDWQSGGDTTTKPPAETQKPTDPPTTEKPPETTQKPTDPPVKIDHPIVGKWSSDSSGSIDWYDGIGNFVMTSGMYSQYEFRADGTFSEFGFWTSSPYARGAREWTRGNYWIEDTGNGTFTLHCTNRLVTLNYNDKTEFEYTDRAFPDYDYTDVSISFWDDGSVRMRIISLYFKVE